MIITVGEALLHNHMLTVWLIYTILEKKMTAKMKFAVWKNEIEMMSSNDNIWCKLEIRSFIISGAEHRTQRIIFLPFVADFMRYFCMASLNLRMPTMVHWESFPPLFIYSLANVSLLPRNNWRPSIRKFKVFYQTCQ